MAVACKVVEGRRHYLPGLTVAALAAELTRGDIDRAFIGDSRLRRAWGGPAELAAEQLVCFAESLADEVGRRRLLSSPMKIGSIGYSGRDAEWLRLALLRADIDLLIDVRADPEKGVSWTQPGKLEKSLGPLIEVQHWRGVGNTYRPPRHIGPFAQLMALYRDQLKKSGGHITLSKHCLYWVGMARRVAFLCACSRHEACHRSILMQELGALLPLEPVILPVQSEQADLFEKEE